MHGDVSIYPQNFFDFISLTNADETDQVEENIQHISYPCQKNTLYTVDLNEELFLKDLIQRMKYTPFDVVFLKSCITPNRLKLSLWLKRQFNH